VNLFGYSIDALFMKPDIAAKESSHQLSQDDSLEDMTLPSHTDTCSRIKDERKERQRGKDTMEQLRRQIEDTGPDDEAVDRVQAMIICIFKVLRNRLADQMELMAESFFLLPMLRLLESEMCDIELDDETQAEFSTRREFLVIDKNKLQKKLDNFTWALNETEMFGASLDMSRKSSL
jgi:hypothetical protein